MLKDNKDEAFDLLRMSLTSPHSTAPISNGFGAGDFRLKRDTYQSAGDCQPPVRENGLWRPSYGRPTRATWKACRGEMWPT